MDGGSQGRSDAHETCNDTLLISLDGAAIVDDRTNQLSFCAMHAVNFWKTFSITVGAAALLAGCASNPAPVANHSFGGSSGQPASTTSAASAAQPVASSGVQTFGLGGHANGTLGPAGYT
ncbi:MAG: hypothetical protein ACREPK_12195, partial [Rhodanobacteraceae bacterium]